MPESNKLHKKRQTMEACVVGWLITYKTRSRIFRTQQSANRYQKCCEYYDTDILEDAIHKHLAEHLIAFASFKAGEPFSTAWGIAIRPWRYVVRMREKVKELYKLSKTEPVKVKF